MTRIKPDDIQRVRERLQQIRENQVELHRKVDEHRNQHNYFKESINTIEDQLDKHRSRFFWLLGGIGSTLVATIIMLFETILQ